MKTRKSSFRETPRPEREQIRYWFPVYQEWLSLNELAYLKSQTGPNA